MNPGLNQPQPTRHTKRTKVAIWLMAGPTALLILGFMGFAAVNWIAAGSSQPSTAECATTQTNNGTSSLFGDDPSPVENCGLFTETPAYVPFVNIGLFIITVLAFLAWLPGLIIGIVLLATKPQIPTQQI